MAWCEASRVDFVLGLTKHQRLIQQIADELRQAQTPFQETGQAVRVFEDFSYQTLKSWSQSRQVIGKAEHLAKGANPRLVATSLPTKRRPPPTIHPPQIATGPPSDTITGKNPRGEQSGLGRGSTQPSTQEIRRPCFSASRAVLRGRPFFCHRLNLRPF